MSPLLQDLDADSVASSAPAVTRSTSRTAVQRILDAFFAGHERPWSWPTNGPTATRVAAETKRTLRMGPLAPADRATLASLSEPRERGLAYARANELTQAADSMRASRLLLALARLSPAGRAYAETMQSAAESYVSYQRRDYDAAFAQMRAALDATNHLAVEWGECEFIVCRRIDLGHNLMRVDMRRGALPSAVARGITLLGATLAAIDQLGAYVTGLLCELVASTLAELAALLSTDDARRILAPFFSRFVTRSLPSSRTEAWIALEYALLEDPTRLDIAAVEAFLGDGRERTPALWYGIALHVAGACEMLDAHDGEDAADTIFAVLASAERVPDSIRERVATPAAQRRSIATLLRRAHEAFAEGRGRFWGPPALDAAQAVVETDLLSRLTPNDRLTLARLAPPREYALSLARRNDIEAARASMGVARLSLSFATGSDECRLYARTLHEAAESYLAYRAGDFPAAATQMRAAIGTTEELANAWGDCPFIVFRRVHLQHNLMRVHASSGASAEAMAIAPSVLELLAPSTESDAAELFFNGIMGTVAELLPRLTPTERARFLTSLNGACPSGQRSWRGRQWLAVASATVLADPRAFIALAESFLRGGRRSAATLWYAVAYDLLAVYDRLSPAAPAAAEIRAELRTAAAVPACMRRL